MKKSHKMETTTLRIHSTDVILTDYEPGKGKIIISNDSHGFNFSYFWGAMGDPIKEFVQRIDTGYFINKLSGPEHGDIDLKKTVKAVREHWRKEGQPWYRFMDEQKDLRYELKQLEHCYNEQDFIYRMGEISTHFKTYGRFTTDFEDSINELTSEPWNFICYRKHPEHIWLESFHPLLKKALTAL